MLQLWLDLQFIVVAFYTLLDFVYVLVCFLLLFFFFSVSISSFTHYTCYLEGHLRILLNAVDKLQRNNF